MRLRTILTLPAATPRTKAHLIGENVLVWAAHRTPRALAYRTFIDVGVRAIRDDEEVPAVKFIDVLQRAERGA